MIGMILCGGYGKRLKPYTEDIPKPLIDITDDYTILDRQLYDMANSDIERVILLTGYLSSKIEERYGERYRGMRIQYLSLIHISEPTRLGMISYAVFCLKKKKKNKQKTKSMIY